MTKTQHNEVEAGVVHHIHHRPHEEIEEYKREITLTGSTATINISSNDPKENVDFLAGKAKELFCKVKEMDRNE